MKRTHSGKEIIDFIIYNVEENADSISTLASKKFKVSRQSIHRYLQNLVKNGTLDAKGNTRSRKYILRPLLCKDYNFTVSPKLEEDRYWRQNIQPLLEGIRLNILNICHYGITEMMNNIIEHSESKIGSIQLKLFPNRIELIVKDSGVGIFRKIAKELNLEDERHAILELTKGKLTTDKAHHTGEGIFFTSRMFDEFSIISGTLFFSYVQGNEENWLIQKEKETLGTMIIMSINNRSSRTVNQVFSKYASPANEFSFSRTHVPVALARYGDEQLVSRSQAKRLLTRLEPFKEVFLDFQGVDSIGQAFADEIFRVFKNEHPEIEIICVHTNKEVENMIKRVTSGLPGHNQLKLGM